MFTVVTPKMADLVNVYRNELAQKIMDIIAGQALSGINYPFQSFSGFALLGGQIAGIGLKKSLNYWTCPFQN